MAGDRVTDKIPVRIGNIGHDLRCALNAFPAARHDGRCKGEWYVNYRCIVP